MFEVSNSLGRGAAEPKSGHVRTSAVVWHVSLLFLHEPSTCGLGPCLLGRWGFSAFLAPRVHTEQLLGWPYSMLCTFQAWRSGVDE